MVINSPTYYNGTDNLASHLYRFLVVFFSYMTIKQNWNNEPNAKAYND